MKYWFLFSFFLLKNYALMSQFTGIYVGQVNGDNVELNLNQDGSVLTGTMKDSKQTYMVSGTCNGYYMTAKAVEHSLSIVFILSGKLIEGGIAIDADLEYMGTKQKAFSTVLASTDPINEVPPVPPSYEDNITKSPGLPEALNGKYIDPLLIGTWREESHYSSGYGSDFSGSTYSYFSFNNNHTLSNGGSQVNISGSDFSGSSGGQNSGAILPNIWYYNIGNKIMIYANTNGTRQTLELGQYYIENGKMLFTQTNTGKKTLYTKM